MMQHITAFRQVMRHSQGHTKYAMTLRYLSSVKLAPTPTPLVAATAIVYAVLFTNPVIVQVVPDGTVHDFPPGVAVAV